MASEPQNHGLVNTSCILPAWSFHARLSTAFYSSRSLSCLDRQVCDVNITMCDKWRLKILRLSFAFDPSALCIGLIRKSTERRAVPLQCQCVHRTTLRQQNEKGTNMQRERTKLWRRKTVKRWNCANVLLADVAGDTPDVNVIDRWQTNEGTTRIIHTCRRRSLCRGWFSLWHITNRIHIRRQTLRTIIINRTTPFRNCCYPPEFSD